jgi:hypothetical protein
VDEGRAGPLGLFLFASFAIAGAQWALSPQIAPFWFPVPDVSDSAYFTTLFALSFLWLGVAIVGLIKCGWPGLLMLIPVKYGSFAFYLIGGIHFLCAVYGECP